MHRALSDAGGEQHTRQRGLCATHFCPIANTCSAAYTLFPHPLHISSPTTLSPTLVLGLSPLRSNPLSSSAAAPPANGTEMGRASRKFGRVMGVDGSAGEAGVGPGTASSEGTEGGV